MAQPLAARNPKAGPGPATCLPLTVPDGSWLHQKITSRRSAWLPASAGSGCCSCRVRRHPAFPGSYPCRSWGYGKLFRVAPFARLAARVRDADCDLKAVAGAACCAELVAWLSRPGWASAVLPRTCLAWGLTVSGCGSRERGVSSRSCLTWRGHRFDLSPHAGITRDGCARSGQCRPGMFAGLAPCPGFSVPLPPRRDRGDGRQRARPEPRLSASGEGAQPR